MDTQKALLVIVGLVVIAAGAWYFIFSGAASEKGPIDTGDAVAVVNGEEISRADFDALESQIALQQGIDTATLDTETRNRLEADIVDELIAQTLLRQASDESGIVISQEDVDAQINATIAQTGGEEAFRQALAENNLSEEELRERANTQLAVQAYLEQELNLSSVEATEEEIDLAYAEANTQGEVPPLEEMREQIRGLVIRQKQQELVAEHIAQLREQASVEVLL